MTPFQFIVVAALVVIALLLGTLVGYASVLLTKIRHANSVMRRIEEALVSRTGVFASATTPTATAVQLPEIAIKAGEAARLLTIRDLKIGPAEAAQSEGESSADDELTSVPAKHAENEIVAASLQRLTPASAEHEATSPVSAAASRDPVDKKDRDELLSMLNNQRRRRRARQGY